MHFCRLLLPAIMATTHLCIDEVCKVLQPLLVRNGLKGRANLTNDDREAPAVVTCVNTAQHSTAQHSTAQHSAAQHSTAQQSAHALPAGAHLTRFRLCNHVQAGLEPAHVGEKAGTKTNPVAHP
jgi:adenine-specific DNA-methyltransferase